MEVKMEIPSPVLNKKEVEKLDQLKEQYIKMCEPGHIKKAGEKIGKLVPDKYKEKAVEFLDNISEQELMKKIMESAAEGFQIIEKNASKYTINETMIIKELNKNLKKTLDSIEQICFLRSYEIAKVVNKVKGRNLIYAFGEGAGTGFAGFTGIPFNITFSTFLFFRAVQAIAMTYGYDVKNDSSELVIASQVYASAINPSNCSVGSSMSDIIAKIMLLSQATTIKQVSKQSWTKMAERGGIPLLLTQLRALANASAKKALDKAGKKGLENKVFTELLEQIGRKLSQKTIINAVPYVSAILSGAIDITQMNRVLDFADVFYQKRFILEKKTRIETYMDCNYPEDEIIDVEIVE